MSLTLKKGHLVCLIAVIQNCLMPNTCQISSNTTMLKIVILLKSYLLNHEEIEAFFTIWFLPHSPDH